MFKNTRFAMKQLRIGRRYYIAIVLNRTFDMTDGRVRFYRSSDEYFRAYSLRVGHFWVNFDIFGKGN
jgi:hypothetical protein